MLITDIRFFACRVFNIGIGVHQGKGLYAETNIVTFAPLYEIDNQSSYRLAIAQRHITQSEVTCHDLSFCIEFNSCMDSCKNNNF